MPCTLTLPYGISDGQQIFDLGGLNLKFSAPSLRSLRLHGECFPALIHRRDAKVAETTQRKTAIDVMKQVTPLPRVD
jgi:hypothetical protein